jgi:pimeloyl-ACP methyl ester carboxylesterase
VGAVVLRRCPPAERTAVCGVSASGEVSLAIGLRHPDIYGAIFSASPGAGYRPPAVMPSQLPRIYVVAGTQEPFFLNATRWADALRDAGADVVMTERLGKHGDPFLGSRVPADRCLGLRTLNRRRRTIAGCLCVRPDPWH